MRQRYSSILKEESAAVAVIVAVLITLFVALTAFVVDVGYMYEMRRQLQSAADAGALAGMIEKIEGSTNSEVFDEATNYALKNDLIDTAAGSLEVLDSLPHTEITEGYVLIGVRKEAKLLFAPILGISSKWIYAQAKAKRVYVTGGRGLVPWGVSTLIPTYAEASVSDTTVSLEKDTVAEALKGRLPTLAAADGGTAVLKGILPTLALADGGTEVLKGRLPTLAAAPDETQTAWKGWLPIVQSPVGDGNLVDVTIYNSQDFPQTFNGVDSIVVHGADDVVRNVWLENNTLGPGDDTFLYITTTTSETPKATVGNDSYPASAFTFDSGNNRYWAPITAPQNTESLQTFEVKVSVGSEHYNNAARLIVRGQNSPVQNIEFGPLHFSTAGGSTPISVKLTDFEFEKEYNLKVVSDPESGNFQALDFRYVYRPPDYTNEGTSTSAADYYDNILYYPGLIMIGDIIVTKTGNLSGPATTKIIDEKIAGCDYSYNEWKYLDPPQNDCGRLLAVPIVERIERMTGQSEVIVVSIAEFYLEHYEKEGNEKINITGVFLRHFRSGEYSDIPPPTGLYTETVRLDKTTY